MEYVKQSSFHCQLTGAYLHRVLNNIYVSLGTLSWTRRIL